eukprot:TRINITY_DN36_c0_g1_i1.p2 TRINITY_DN36_c0_g1~~TRINITY_DN36_c0_g1_i1.p2  ORF type:complete len:165 (-),score=60.21 TRINITY_DN36_c0_g1_i1:81-575(-)
MPEISGGLSRAEIRRKKEEEQRASYGVHGWRAGGSAKVIGAQGLPQPAGPAEDGAERERSRSRSPGTIAREERAARGGDELKARLAKSAAELAAARAAAASEAAGDGEAPAAEQKSAAQQAKDLMAKEKEKARLKKLAKEEAQKEKERLQKEKAANKGPSFKRY